MANPRRSGYQFSEWYLPKRKTMLDNPAVYGWTQTGQLAQNKFPVWQLGPALAYFDECWRVRVGENNGTFPGEHIRNVTVLTNEEIEKQGVELCKVK